MKHPAILVLLLVLSGAIACVPPVPAPPSNDANLSGLSLSFGTLSPAFASGTTAYTASIINGVATVTVTPIAADADATIKVRVNNGAFASDVSGIASNSLSLNAGAANPIDIQVTAADQTTVKTYTVTVTRAAQANDNADLGYISISNSTLFPGFAPGTTVYSGLVSYLYASVTVTPIASDSLATMQFRLNGGSWTSIASGVSSGSLAVSVGDNTIEIQVTAFNTTSKTYTITVNRTDILNIPVTTYSELQQAVPIAVSGTVITINGNSLSCNAQLVLNKESANITIQAGAGFASVLDFSTMTGTGDSGGGIYIKGSYYTIKGLTITKAPSKGVIIKSKSTDGLTHTSSYNTLENCVFSYNGDSGVTINTNSTNDASGSHSSNNLVKNCDSYMNADLAGSTGPGGNADGFSCKLGPGVGNKFIGCRAWYNSDDGFDFITTSYTITVENCWTWHNGDGSLYSGWSGNWGGNGQGFKGGGGGTTVSHIFKNCVAFDTWYGKSGSKKGFDSNNNLGGNIYYNCLAYNCQYGFSYGSGTYGAPNNPVFKNCVSFGNTYNTNFSGATNIVEQTNDWNLGIASSTADFKSHDVNQALAPRQADGSLPNNDFFKINGASDQLVDKGTDVGLPYLGAAPDLGAFECY